MEGSCTMWGILRDGYACCYLITVLLTMINCGMKESRAVT